jgi:hypothetical protein
MDGDTIALVGIAVGQIVTVIMAIIARVASNKAAGIAEVTHDLVNSNMTRQLRINASLAEHLARVTNEKEHIEAAKLAREMLEHHEVGKSPNDS